MKKLLLLLLICFAIHAEEEVLPKTISSPYEQYNLIKVLGEGFFGKVYLAQDSNGNSFAIKSLKGGSSEEGLGNAWREFRRGQLVRHPNIVNVYNIFESETEKGTTYMVMELVEGQTLRNVPTKSVIYPDALTASIHLIEALRYAISFKLFYIDMHNDNIMLNDASDVKIVDLASFYTFAELIGFSEKEEDEQPLSKKEVELKLFFSHNSNLMKTITDSGLTLETSILCGYLHNIIDMCIQIIMKSNLEREQKLEMYAAIKKIGWAFTEDLEENLPSSIETYFDQLIQILSHS